MFWFCRQGEGREWAEIPVVQGFVLLKRALYVTTTDRDKAT